MFSGAIMELDLGKVEPSISGPKRPHDRVSISDQKKEWSTLLTNPTGFKGYGITADAAKSTSSFTY